MFKTNNTLTVTITARNGDVFTIRPLQTSEDFEQCVSIQESIWGTQNTMTLTPSFLKINQHIGGVAAGAFDSQNSLKGFIVSIPGYTDNQPYHWSFRMGVVGEGRDLKLGEHLKQYQKKACLSLGFNYILWTYNPFESRNAYLNLIKLGCKVDSFVEELFTSSSTGIHKGDLGDRFLVKWDLLSPQTYHAYTQEEVTKIPNLTTSFSGNFPSQFRIQIPVNVQEFKIKHADELLEMSYHNRAVLSKGLATHTINGFFRGDDCSYYIFKEKMHD